MEIDEGKHEIYKVYIKTQTFRKRLISDVLLRTNNFPTSFLWFRDNISDRL